MPTLFPYQISHPSPQLNRMPNVVYAKNTKSLLYAEYLCQNITPCPLGTHCHTYHLVLCKSTYILLTSLSMLRKSHGNNWLYKYVTRNVISLKIPLLCLRKRNLRVWSVIRENNYRKHYFYGLLTLSADNGFSSDSYPMASRAAKAKAPAPIRIIFKLKTIDADDSTLTFCHKLKRRWLKVLLLKKATKKCLLFSCWILS